MTYSTAQKLLDQFGAKELAEVAGPRDRAVLSGTVLRTHIAGGDISEATADVQLAAAEAKARIVNAIAEAEGIADAYIRSGGYSTPLTTVPEYIAGAVEDIARWLLHKDHPSEAVTERNTEARKLLDRVASGKMVIAQADGETPTMASTATIKVSAPDEVYTDATLNAFGGNL